MKVCHLITWCVLALAEGNVHSASNFRQKTKSLKHRTFGQVARPANASKDVEETDDMVPSLSKVDVVETVKRDYIRTHNVFLPGMSFYSLRGIFLVISVLLGITWFTVFYQCCYQADHKEVDDEHWKRQLKNLEEVAEIDRQRHSGLMLVFHHPNHPHEDRLSKVSFADFDELLVFDRNSFRNPNVRTPHKYLNRTTQLKWTTRKPQSWMNAHDEGRESQDESQGDETTLEDARMAFLQDLCQDLLSMGFSVEVFSSCDEDEIFMSVQLSNEDVFEHYLHKNKFQLEINRSLIGKLGIGQPADVPAPKLRYDPKTIQALYQAKVIQNSHWSEVYRSHTDMEGGGAIEVKIINDRDRIRLVYELLSKFVDLDAAVSSGFLASWYPIHAAHRIPQLKAAWGNPRLLLDISFLQPLFTLGTYFGSRVAFIFAWIGFYSKAMFALLPLAVVASATAFVFQHFYSYKSGGKVAIMIFNAIIILWSRIVYNLWEREQNYLRKVWSVSKTHTKHEYIERPSFRGEYMPTKEDSNNFEKHYSSKILLLRQSFSMFVTAFFCIIVAVFIYMWYGIFEGRLTIFSGSLLVLQVKLFEVVWNVLTPVLTEFENHKYQYAYNNSYIWKSFIFQAINSYSAYFYIAIKMRHSEEGCPDGSCLGMLQSMLIILQVSLSVVSIFVFLVDSYWVRFKLWYEVYQYRKAHEGRDPPQRSHSEEEAKMKRFGEEQQINFMCRLILSAGFIILFGGLVPIMVPLSLCLFAVNLRIGAHVLLTYTQRPFPRTQGGIGAWKDIMLLLMRIGLVFSGFLLVSFSDIFTDTPLATKLAGLVIYCTLALISWGAVDTFVPVKSEDETTLAQQHQYVISKIQEKVQDKLDDGNEKFRQALKKSKEEFWNSPIAAAEWSEIRPLALQSAGGSS